MCKYEHKFNDEKKLFLFDDTLRHVEQLNLKCHKYKKEKKSDYPFSKCNLFLHMGIIF